MIGIAAKVLEITVQKRALMRSDRCNYRVTYRTGSERWGFSLYRDVNPVPQGTPRDLVADLIPYLRAAHWSFPILQLRLSPANESHRIYNPLIMSSTLFGPNSGGTQVSTNYGSIIVNPSRGKPGKLNSARGSLYQKVN